MFRRSRPDPILTPQPGEVTVLGYHEQHIAVSGCRGTVEQHVHASLTLAVMADSLPMLLRVANDGNGSHSIIWTAREVEEWERLEVVFAAKVTLRALNETEGDA